MRTSKYATISEDGEGKLHLTLGKEKTEFSLAQIKDGDDNITMHRLELERKALIHLPEQMSSDQFSEFVDGRQIGDVIDDCLGLNGGGE
ncbi:hypothetical protein [Natrinema pallidum]|uniref:hypothetical protein n=1 Tax=Natrinema pallidum TaxID=69527 RepID=UPI003753BDC5